MMSDEQIHAGDTVHHKPTGERWYVLGVNHKTGKLCVGGWPYTVANISDCSLEEHRNGITDLERISRTRMFGTGWDE